MRVLVTGGSGFLGSRVLPILCDRGHETVALARSPAAADSVAQRGAKPIAGDLDESTSLEGAFVESGAAALVNLASLGFGHARTIVAAAEKAGFDKAVFISTTAIFTSLDARSKSTRIAAEDAIRTSSLRWTILRPTMIYGAPGDRNMARLLHLVRRSPVVPLPGGGRHLQQPVHVDDLATATAEAVERPVTVGRTYDVAGPDPLTLTEVVAQAYLAVGRAPRCVPVPLRAAISLARLYEHLPQARLRAEQLARLAENKVFDIGPARRDLAFSPRSFAEGICQEAQMLR